MPILDFPNNPTPGQQYNAPNSAVYTWDSAKGVWTSSAGGTPPVPNPPSITTPSITFPVDGADNVNVSAGLTLTSSTYAGINSPGSHQSSDWQVSLDNPLVISSNTITGVSSLSLSTTLTILGANLDGFSIGDTVTNGLSGINTATGTISSINSTTVVLNPGDPDWSVGQTLYKGTQVINSVANTSNLTSFNIASPTLLGNSTYFARVRYRSSSSPAIVSSWSAWCNFATSTQYITCTPTYPSLPVTYPPYNCNTNVNTAGVTNLAYAWSNCPGIGDFPCIDTSACTNFQFTWHSSGLTSLPPLDTSSGTNFQGAWSNCTNGFISFPLLDLSSGTNFQSAWSLCTALRSFPGTLDLSSGTNFEGAWSVCTFLGSFPGTLDLSSGTSFQSAWTRCSSLTSFPGTLDLSSGTNFQSAWDGCTALRSFPAGMFDTCTATNFSFAWGYCALTQTSVNNILVSLDTAGQSNGTVHLDNGTSAAPSGAGLTAKLSLVAKGWIVYTN